VDGSAPAVELAEADAIAKEYRTADPAGVVRRALPLYVLGEYRNEGSAAERRITIKLHVKRGEETIVDEERATEERGDKLPVPHDIKATLDDYVIG